MNIFARTERLIGADGLARLNAARVILFGTGSRLVLGPSQRF